MDRLLRWGFLAATCALASWPGGPIVGAASQELWAAFPTIAVEAASDGVLEMPYAASGSWWAGQTHTHLAPHGQGTLSETVRIYRDLGLSFMAVTEHDHVTPTADVEGFTVLSGAEVSMVRGGAHPHVVALGADAPVPHEGRAVQAVLDDVRRQGALAVLAHPDHRAGRGTAPSWTLEDARSLDGYAGIEVYNHITDLWRQGNPWAFEHWFAALSAGRAVWGLAVDDPHAGHDGLGYGYVVVQAPGRDAAGLLEAMATGRMVAVSTPTPGPPGVWPGMIRADGAVLQVVARPDRPAAAIEVYDARGALRSSAPHGVLAYAATGDEGFLVAVLRGADGSTVILQPVRVRADVGAPAWAVERPVEPPPERLARLSVGANPPSAVAGPYAVLAVSAVVLVAAVGAAGINGLALVRRGGREP